LPHVGCFEHVLNLAVHKCLAVPEGSALIGKFRKLVSVLKSSALKKTALQDAEKELLEPVDEATKRVSAEKSSTISLLLPTMERFVKRDFMPKQVDSSMLVKAKDAIQNDLLKRYNKKEEQNLLI